MPRPARLTVSKNSAGWMLNVAPKLSETGKRQRLFFKSRDAAMEEKRRRADYLLEHGNRAGNLRPSQMEDAQRALEILDGSGVTLTALAKDHIESERARAASITLREAWERALELRADKRPTTIANMTRAGRQLPGWFMSMNLTDITKKDVERACKASSDSRSAQWANYQKVHAVLADAITDDLLESNPATKARITRPASDPPSIFETPEKLKNLLSIAADIQPETVTAFAVLAFAGVRSAELARLDWDCISLENRNIRIPAKASKTHTIRNVHIEENLAAWLEADSDKSGKIIPKNWKPKSTAVRKAADASAFDIFRHSFGSYFLAAFGDVDALRSNMGHTTLKTFYQYYHRALTKREALPYWKIAPEGVEIPAVREVA